LLHSDLSKPANTNWPCQWEKCNLQIQTCCYHQQNLLTEDLS